MPLVTEIAIQLKRDGYDMPIDVLNAEQFVDTFVKKVELMQGKGENCG